MTPRKPKTKKGVSSPSSEDFGSSNHPEKVKPKKVATSFMHFVKENAKTIIAEKKLKSASDATKILGERWRAMTDEQKKKYE